MLARLNRLPIHRLSRLPADRFTRLQAASHDDGFTLIELLVVIIIIGILAAIAIPVFLNQRQKGYDAGIKADLRNAATAEETYLGDYGTYTATVGSSTTPTGLWSEGFRPSANDYSASSPTLTIAATSNHGYCITGVSASGKTWFFDSSLGGLQPYKSTAYTCSVV